MNDKTMGGFGPDGLRAMFCEHDSGCLSMTYSNLCNCHVQRFGRYVGRLADSWKDERGQYEARETEARWLLEHSGPAYGTLISEHVFASAWRARRDAWINTAKEK